MKIHTGIAAMLLVFASPSMAAVGTITEQSDSPATIARQKSTLSGKMGSGVEMQDVVDTTTGKVGITFRDETRVEVSDHSRLEIDEFVYDPAAPSAGKLAVNFAQGTVRMASESPTMRASASAPLSDCLGNWTARVGGALSGAGVAGGVPSAAAATTARNCFRSTGLVR